MNFTIADVVGNVSYVADLQSRQKLLVADTFHDQLERKYLRVLLVRGKRQGEGHVPSLPF